MGFDSDTALLPVAGGLDLEVPANWRVGDVTNGGYVAAVLTRALVETVAAPSWRPRSLTVHYLSACRPGPGRIAVALERAGRSVRTLSARMTQGGATVALALAAFGQDRPGPEFQHRAMPEAPPPEEVAALDVAALARAGGSQSFATNWEYRRCVGGEPFSSAAEAITGGWLRLAEPRLLDASLLAAMADAWIPPVIPTFDAPRWMLTTVDLTVHFRAALPPPAAAPGDYSFAVFRSSLAADGYWESDGVIWSRDGRVLAHSRQLAVFGQ